MLLRVLHLLLLSALGLMLSGAPLLWTDSACAEECQEESAARGGVPGDGCADPEDADPEDEESGECGGAECCMCACRSPSRAVLGDPGPPLPARTEGLTARVPPLEARACLGVPAEVFLPPKVG